MFHDIWSPSIGLKKLVKTGLLRLVLDGSNTTSLGESSDHLYRWGVARIICILTTTTAAASRAQGNKLDITLWHASPERSTDGGVVITLTNLIQTVLDEAVIIT